LKKKNERLGQRWQGGGYNRQRIGTKKGLLAKTKTSKNTFPNQLGGRVKWGRKTEIAQQGGGKNLAQCAKGGEVPCGATGGSGNGGEKRGVGVITGKTSQGSAKKVKSENSGKFSSK